MLYTEYTVRLPEGPKKLGLLGEIHIYNSEDSRIAEQMVRGFDNFAMEGSKKDGKSYALMGLLLKPQIMAYCAASDRSTEIMNAVRYARKLGKEIHELEPNSDKMFNWKQKLVLTAGIALSIPLAPLTYLGVKYGDDPFSGNNLELSNAQDDKQESQNKFIAYSLGVIRPKRDEEMAKNTATILREVPGSLLSCFGRSHMRGIMDNLERILSELARGKALHLRELARLTKLHPTTVTSTVDKLVKQDILIKKHNAELNRTYAQFASSLKAKNRQVRVNIDKIIDSGLIDALNDHYSFPTVFLFGSMAKAENHWTSDVDLFIIAEDTPVFDVTMYEKKLNSSIQLFVHTSAQFKKLCKTSPELVNNVLNGIKLSGYVEVFE